MVAGANSGRGQCLEIQKSVRATQSACGNAPESGQSATFPHVNVGLRVADQLISRLGLASHADLIGHGPGRYKQGGLFPKSFSDHGFQTLDRGIFTKNVVARFGSRHGGQHSG